jgi:hypothetical protein
VRETRALRPASPCNASKRREISGRGTSTKGGRATAHHMVRRCPIQRVRAGEETPIAAERKYELCVFGPAGGEAPSTSPRMDGDQAGGCSRWSAAEPGKWLRRDQAAHALALSRSAAPRTDAGPPRTSTLRRTARGPPRRGWSRRGSPSSSMRPDARQSPRLTAPCPTRSPPRATTRPAR